MPFLGGYGPPIDQVNTSRVNGGDALWNAGPSGLAAYSWNFTNATTADLGFTTGGFSVGIFCYIAVATGAGTPTICLRQAYTNETTNTGWGVHLNTTPRYIFNVMNNNAQANYELASNSVPTVGNHTIVATNDGIGRRCLYIDGILDNTKSANPLPASTTATLSQDGSAAIFSYLTVIWSRPLSEFESAAFQANPWQIFLALNGRLPPASPFIQSQVNAPLPQRIEMIGY